MMIKEKDRQLLFSLSNYMIESGGHLSGYDMICEVLYSCLSDIFNNFFGNVQVHHFGGPVYTIGIPTPLKGTRYVIIDIETDVNPTTSEFSLKIDAFRL